MRAKEKRDKKIMVSIDPCDDDKYAVCLLQYEYRAYTFLRVVDLVHKVITYLRYVVCSYLGEFLLMPNIG